MFKLYLFLAKHGWFRHHGLFDVIPRGVPAARVQYKDGKYSVNMAIGNAVDYAEMFGGKVVPPKKK